MTFTLSITEPGPAYQMKYFHEVTTVFNELHEYTGSNAHSGTLWLSGVRNAKNFLEAPLLMLDVDGTWSIDEAKSEFGNTKDVLITTSKSHRSPRKIDEFGNGGKAISAADYFHVYIGLPEPIQSKEEYLEITHAMVNAYPVDKNVKDAARFFYPNPNQTYWYS